ncbi:uncharacterized protein LOC128597355 [Nycticebus coucang]|uniref:uncharacterized protein LOC128597355 n=1 Tax=Nycticebus coucang TaxID=9470 RepID=UPI00234DADE7|nr:uncharacterized protein LOC128597355 [Nycticebus coucang]
MAKRNFSLGFPACKQLSDFLQTLQSQQPAFQSKFCFSFFNWKPQGRVSPSDKRIIKHGVNTVLATGYYHCQWSGLHREMAAGLSRASGLRENTMWKPHSLYNIILEVTTHLFCSLLYYTLFRSESLNLARMINSSHPCFCNTFRLLALKFSHLGNSLSPPCTNQDGLLGTRECLWEHLLQGWAKQLHDQRTPSGKAIWVLAFGSQKHSTFAKSVLCKIPFNVYTWHLNRSGWNISMVSIYTARCVVALNLWKAETPDQRARLQDGLGLGKSLHFLLGRGRREKQTRKVM